MMIKKLLPPILLAISLFILYLSTMAPGLTWANAGIDGGDLISAAATGGVAHPTGYPTYLLLAEVFQHLPVGTLAFRTSLLSAVAAVLAAVLVYGVITWLPNSPARGNGWAGLAAGYFFGLAPLVWSQAVITEVYTLQALFTALVVFLAVWIPTHNKPAHWDGLLGLMLGLSLGNHLTSIFLIPAALMRGKAGKPWQLDIAALVRGGGGLAAGLLVYTALPLRALAHPPINWGNPATWSGFTWLVSGELYQRRLLDIPIEGIWQRLGEAGVSLVSQFELVGIALALLGLILFFKPTRLVFITVWNVVIYTAFAVIYNSADSFLFLIPVILSGAIWVGLGLGGLMQANLPYGRVVKPGLVVLLGVFLALAAVERLPRVDASRDERAEQFGAQVMAGVPANAILVAEGDQAVFTLWYFHFALKQRPDVMVLAKDLLHFEWYDESLRFTYPAARWPRGLFWVESVAAANPERPVCTIAWEAEQKIACAPGR